MKYTGRLIIILLTFVGSLAEVFFLYFYHGIFKVTEMVGALPFLPLAWWLGYQYDKAKFYSEKDYLTGLYNRRYTFKMLDKLFKKADRKGNQFTMFVVDCNNFKSINDNYGHKMGDRVLEKIGTLLLEITKREDLVARWGGDEFLMVTPKSQTRDIKLMEERIETGLQTISQEIDLDISVSIGTSTYPKEAEDVDSLLSIADHNMYSVKSSKKSNKHEKV